MSVTATPPRASSRRRAPVRRDDSMPRVLQVARWDPRRDGALTDAALQQKLQSLGFEPLPRSHPAGAIVSARVHHRERADAVLAGLLKVTIDADSVILTAGDIAFVPGGTVRRIEPVGSAPVLCIEAVGRSTCD